MRGRLLIDMEADKGMNTGLGSNVYNKGIAA